MVSNVGGTGAEESVPVRVKVDGGEAETSQMISRLSAGESSSFTVVRELALGEHVVLFEIGGTEKSVDVNVATADLVVELMDWSIFRDGSIELTVRVANHGELAAEAVKVWADWESDGANPESVAGGQAVPALIETLAAGVNEVVQIPVEIPTGSYDFTLSAETESVEVLRNNNVAEESVEVEYIHLRTSVESMVVTEYDREGSGLVQLVVLVDNDGPGESGKLNVGVSCGEVGEGCSEEVQIDSISPGETGRVILELSAPQGESAVSIYAGAMDSGYRWGHHNTVSSVLVVPEKPAVRLQAQALADVTGYRSDGTADLRLSIELRNDGYLEAEDRYALDVACLKGGSVVEDCGTEAMVDLSDGFGPGEAVLELSVPMGSVLEIDLDAEDFAAQELEIPERILGVDRDVWVCYSDRPGAGSSQEGCGGWRETTVAKWDHEMPVRVWATGKAEYISVLETVLDEIVPLVNLDFEVVDSQEKSDIEVHLGVPREKASEIGWRGCVHFGGCADTRMNEVGNVKYGFIVVWDWGEPGEYVKGVILHELLHVVVPIGHRHTYDGLMGEGGRLSLFDEALIRLHSHRLVNPAMTMAEIEELIVFNDELLDPKPKTEYMNVWSVTSRAAEVLVGAGSARFNLTGNIANVPARTRKFGPALYEVSDFTNWSTGLAGTIHYRDRADRIIFWEGGVWRELNGVWKEIDRQEAFEITGWDNHWASPLVALRAILAASSDDVVRVVSRSQGQITVEAAILREGHSRDVVMIVDEETYEISRYTMTTQPWLRDSNEQAFVMTIDDIEYGIEIEIPSSLVAARSEQ